jgi:hypothetical protein
MFVHTCPLTGHKRKFASGRDAKKWLKEQQAKFVPDHVPVIGVTKGVGYTKHVAKRPPAKKRFSEVPKEYRHDTVADIYDVHGWQPKNIREGYRKARNTI